MVAVHVYEAKGWVNLKYIDLIIISVAFKTYRDFRTVVQEVGEHTLKHLSKK